MLFFIIHVLMYTFKCNFFICTYAISTFWVRGICQALYALVLFGRLYWRTNGQEIELKYIDVYKLATQFRKKLQNIEFRF